MEIMKARLLLTINALLTSILVVGCASNQPTFNKAAIATSHPLATQAGFRALDQGGNAFDAAVAASAALAVVAPYGAGLGGGSFWLIEGNSGKAILVDARESSPQNASQRKPVTHHDTRSFTESPLSAAIPGHAAALAHVSKKYGIRPLAANLADAVHIAKRGFRADKQYIRYASKRLSTLKQQPSSPFLIQGTIPAKHTVIKQPELATTLVQLGRRGHNGFYQGEIATNLVSDINKAGGAWTLKDLKNYTVIERPTISFNYKDAVIITTPPPSYGGIALQQTLQVLDRFDTSQMTRIEKVDLIARIMRVTNPETAIWLGDPDFSELPIEQLTSGSYLSYLAGNIENNKTVSLNMKTHSTIIENEGITPHVSIVDKWGNKVVVSLSMNIPFGSAFTSISTGVLLNSSLASFSENIRSGNTLTTGKRPLSYMTPTLVETAGSTAVLGISSGQQTVTALIFAILDYMNGEPTKNWSATLRYHYNSSSDSIYFEPSILTTPEKKQLESMGHSIDEGKLNPTDIQVIRSDKATGYIEASSSSAGGGQAIVR